MNIPLFIAKRYLFSKRKRNVVQMISLISLIGVGIGAMALIIVLSVLNGFNNLAVSLFNTFDPPILIEAAEGKTFQLKDFPEEEIKNLKEITLFIPCVQENALITYRENQRIVTLKGVDKGYEKLSDIKEYICAGEFKLQDAQFSYAVLGSEIDYMLGVLYKRSNFPIKVHIPKRKQKFGLHAEESFNSGILIPAGAFMVSADIDDHYVLTNIDFVRNLLDYEKDEVTSVELGVSPDIKNTKSLQKKIQSIIGKDFTAKNRLEQQALFHQTVKVERLAIYLIMSFIIFIATFNIIGSLSLLMLDKKKDVKTLKSIGANKKLIAKIFFSEGMLISFIGALSGLLLGGIICWLQQQFGFIGMGSDNFVVNSFPVKLEAMDFVLVFLLVMAIGAASVGWTVVSRIDKIYKDI